MEASFGTVTSARAATEIGLGSLRHALALLEGEAGAEAEEARRRLQTVVEVLSRVVDRLPGASSTGEDPAGTGTEEGVPEATSGVLPVESLLAPISEERPGGENIRVSGEMNSLRSLTVNRARQSDFQPRWGESADRAVELLRSRTKDLAVVTQLVESLIMSGRTAGLADAFALVHGLLDRYWDHLYPEIEEDDFEIRADELARMQEVGTSALHRALQPVHEFEPPVSGPDDAAAALDEWNAIVSWFDAMDARINERFGMTWAPNLADLRKMLDGYRRKVAAVRDGYSEQDRETEAVRQRESEEQLEREVEEDETRRREERYGESLETVLSELAGDRRPDDAERILEAASGALRRHRPSDPAPWLVSRASRWFRAADSGGARCAPGGDARTRIASLLEAEAWSDLLAAAEDVFVAGGEWWLDLQRLAWTACRRLGDEYSTVADVVARTVVDVVELRPDLPTSTLADLTPSADEATREWIEEMRARWRPAGDGSAGVEGSGGGAEPRRDEDDVRARARRLMQDDRAVEAMGLVEERERAAASGRERFLWRLLLAELLLDHGLAEVALPGVDDLSARIEDLRLENWESKDLVCRVLEAGYRGYSRAAADDESLAEKRNEYYRHLCRLDPSRALRGGGGGAES